MTAAVAAATLSRRRPLGVVVALGVSVELVEDLARAEDQPRHLRAPLGRARVVEDRTERAVGQVLEGGRSALGAQQALGREDDQRAAVVRQGLLAQ